MILLYCILFVAEKNSCFEPDLMVKSFQLK